MGDPNFKPRKIEAEGQSRGQAPVAKPSEPVPVTTTPKPEGVTDEEWFEHLEIMKSIGDYEVMHPELADAPFLDADELTDPELHRRREILRQRYNFNKSRNRPTPPTTNIEGVKSVGEILKDHPLLKNLIKP